MFDMKIMSMIRNKVKLLIKKYKFKELIKTLKEDNPNGKFKAHVANLWSLISYPANQGQYQQFNFFELLNSKD